MITQTTEQWKSGGDCSKCRKKNYCNYSCGPYKKRSKAELASAMRHVIDKVSPGMSEFIEKHGVF